LPEYRAVQLRDADEQWHVAALVNREVTGAVTYQIDGHGGTLIADDLLITSSLGRALLLQFFARHIDQVSQITMTVTADEIPELWATDLAAVTESRTSFPTSPAPMARVLSLDALRGLPVGAGRLMLEIVDDAFLGRQYVLDGTAGMLDVIVGQARLPVATLTAAGLSGLIYGVLDPSDIVVRGLGDVPPEAASELSTLFPRLIPYFFSRF
jgi:hypothetical protein